jgi:hypothetical protein
LCCCLMPTRCIALHCDALRCFFESPMRHTMSHCAKTCFI